MKKLLPHEQRVIQNEIDRVRSEKNAASGRAPDARSISKNDIEKLRDSFAGILTGQVVVIE
jgi:hypothetical protein